MATAFQSSTSTSVNFAPALPPRQRVSRIDLWAVCGQHDQLADATLIVLPMLDEAEEAAGSQHRVRRVDGIFHAGDPFQLVISHPEFTSDAYYDLIASAERMRFASLDAAIDAALAFNRAQLAAGPDVDIDTVPLAQVVQVGEMQEGSCGTVAVRIDDETGVIEETRYRPVRVVWAGIA